ncbi:hypothetical protein [Nocardia sp. NBC_00403]|uniref:hypothetical protein n=1 Tax=Nocardia sp. NBC_00403 TaxID=2975990 RepID=UPI002E2356C3
MTTADSSTRARRREDPHTFEVLGRVMTLLCDNPGPLADCLAPLLWPLLTGGGYALSWCGVTPTESEVAEYLLDAAADDDMTRVLRPGDVRFREGLSCTIVDVRGVQFQLRPAPMVRPETYTALGEYWRIGELALPRR